MNTMMNLADSTQLHNALLDMGLCQIETFVFCFAQQLSLNEVKPQFGQYFQRSTNVKYGRDAEAFSMMEQPEFAFIQLCSL